MALLMLTLWLCVYAGFVLRSGADRLLVTVYPNTPPAFFILTMLLAALLASLIPLRAAARTAGLFLAPIAPILTLVCAYLYVYLRFGRDNFPFLLKDMESEIEVVDDTLTPETAVGLSNRVRNSLLAHQYMKKTADKAALFVEEIGLTILERNRQAKKPVLVELSLFFEEDSVLVIERDSGVLFDLTESDVQVGGLSSFLLSGLMKAHKDKAYLITTGYNRNMLRFPRERKET